VWVALGFSALGASCGGRTRTDEVEDGGSSAAAGSAASAASSAGGARGGSAGTRALGGAAGVPSAGGQAGTATVDATTAYCECPEADYGIETVPNGERLSFGLATDECPAGPVRGHATDVCSTLKLETAACAKPEAGNPCLTLLPYQQVKYVNANGTVFLGSMAEITVDQGGTYPDPLKVLTGSYSVRLVGEAGEITIGGRFVLCGYLAKLLVPCGL